jgi:hypothetical protein
MRLLSVVLLLLAVSLVSLTGCKARGKNGVVAKRPVSHGLLRRASRDRSVEGIGRSLASRGTAQCDCYTCRTKRQQVEEYAVDAGYETIEFQTDPQTITYDQPASTLIDAPTAEPQLLISDPMPAVQEIEGTLVEDFELTNELPDEPEIESIPEVPSQPEVQAEPTIDVLPQLISPETGLNTQDVPGLFEAPKVQETPVVQSTPLKAEQVSTKVEKAPVKALPFVNGSVFKIKTRDDSVLERQRVAPIRRKSIWFTPAPEQRPAPVEPIKTEFKQPVIRQEVSVPVIEHEIKEAAPKNEPIVLKARPVDHHLIYNSRRPTHALVREARLVATPRFTTTNQQPRNTQLQFYPLPPQQPSVTSPSPASPSPVAPTPVAPVQMVPVANPQSGSQLFTPVPHIDEPAELRLKATVVPSGDHGPGSALAAPMARVIPSTNPMLRLNASPTLNMPAQMPAIVKIQDPSQGRVVVGSLQTPQDNTQQGTASAGMNRLHTSPWQPMATGQNGDAQVQQSIRQLMIRPQQEANFSTDGIHR